MESLSNMNSKCSSMHWRFYGGSFDGAKMPKNNGSDVSFLWYWYGPSDESEAQSLNLFR